MIVRCMNIIYDYFVGINLYHFFPLKLKSSKMGKDTIYISLY